MSYRKPRQAFPIIDQDQFQCHPKFRKPKDVERMLYSQMSEDWVTWTAFRLLQKYARTTWWPDLVELARSENPQLILPPRWNETPKVRLWECVQSPYGYETASRDRMRRSENRSWVNRSLIPRPVEGESEIDLIFDNSSLVVFAEAKLGSDISSSTKYDPGRNQIIRNIDCVLDYANGRVPMFWMLVRDSGKGRAYTHLIGHYRAEPNVLVEQLRHHDPKSVIELAGNLSLLLWKDIVARFTEVTTDDDKQIASIKSELLNRVSSDKRMT